MYWAVRAFFYYSLQRGCPNPVLCEGAGVYLVLPFFVFSSCLLDFGDGRSFYPPLSLRFLVRRSVLSSSKRFFLFPVPPNRVLTVPQK